MDNISGLDHRLSERIIITDLNTWAEKKYKIMYEYL